MCDFGSAKRMPALEEAQESVRLGWRDLPRDWAVRKKMEAKIKAKYDYRDSSKQINDELYAKAKSLAEYTDESTLNARIADVMKEHFALALKTSLDAGRVFKHSLRGEPAQQPAQPPPQPVQYAPPPPQPKQYAPPPTKPPFQVMAGGRVRVPRPDTPRPLTVPDVPRIPTPDPFTEEELSRIKRWRDGR